jgi:thioredoxin 1
MGTVPLTETAFDETIAGHRIVLVDVTASWCPPCRRFAPIFAKASEDHPDLVFATLDADGERGLARRLKIRAVPTLLIYRDAVLVHRRSGAVRAAKLERLIAALRAHEAAGD